MAKPTIQIPDELIERLEREQSCLPKLLCLLLNIKPGQIMEQPTANVETINIHEG
ncbi:hypothetical protein [Nostoc sp. ChiQUE01b]|uniref:hypothetical protein n=1 Tax=Nostoc sp. ChiQUE01b TaxID=3075376 RepID=UPI002AD36C07|nr:hypothetical protein [Nostoc sp. ChiQUE01b]